MSRIPATRPGHLAQFGPLNHPPSKRGSAKGGMATRFKKMFKNQPAPVLGWKAKEK